MKENEMIHTGRVLIVEGKYDAARLSHLTDAMILLTDGFGIYSDKKRQQLFKALAQKNGLILLTDSDAAGFRIRTYITNLVGEKNVVQAYVPAIHGKEKRKEQPGKEGLLGVEGVDDAIVLQALRDALDGEHFPVVHLPAIDDRGLHARAFEHGRADFHRITFTGPQDLVQGNFGAHFSRYLFYFDLFADGDAILLAAGFYDRVHGAAPKKGMREHEIITMGVRTVKQGFVCVRLSLVEPMIRACEVCPCASCSA